MECTECGAEVPEGSDTCPQCSAAVAAPGPEAADTSVDTPTVSTGTDAATDEPERTERRWVPLAVAAVVVVALAVGGFFVWQQVAPPNTPAAAVTRMMTAFSAYDGKGVLDNATHSSMTATDVAAFEQQATTAKSTSKNLPYLKNIKVTKTTLASGGATATVQFTASWLTDPTKGTYTVRDETLTVVKQGGKWLVRLFQ
jgi:uncharacterized membrane protein YvbJ